MTRSERQRTPMSHPRSYPDTARARGKTITLTNSERLNAKSVEVNAHPKVNAYKLWAFTLSVHPATFHGAAHRWRGTSPLSRILGIGGMGLCMLACAVLVFVSTRKMPPQPHPPCGKGRLALRPARSTNGRLRSGPVASPCDPSCTAGSAVGGGISRPALLVSACAWASAARRLSATAHLPCLPSAPCIRRCTSGPLGRGASRRVRPHLCGAWHIRAAMRSGPDAPLCLAAPRRKAPGKLSAAST